MKKISVILALTVSIIWGCNYITKDSELQTKINAKQITTIQQLNDVESQKQMYLDLNQYEKNFIWKDRIQTYIDNNILTSEQKIHLENLLSLLNNELFDGRNASQIRLIEQQWAPKAFTLFQKEELRTLLGGLSWEVTQKKKPVDITNLRAVASGCGCNGDSLFDCRACNAQDACQSSGSGCGFLWGYSCTKSCYIAPKNED